jgi:hypothetical protein
MTIGQVEVEGVSNQLEIDTAPEKPQPYQILHSRKFILILTLI